MRLLMCSAFAVRHIGCCGYMIPYFPDCATASVRLALDHLLGAAYFICENMRESASHGMSLYSHREDNTAKLLYSSENRLDGKLCGVGGHFCSGWPPLEAIGSIQHLG